LILGQIWNPEGGSCERLFLLSGAEGALVIADLFLKAAGLPVPLKMVLPPGMDLTDFMKGGNYESIGSAGLVSSDFCVSDMVNLV
jgi:hypothetical protein